MSERNRYTPPPLYIFKRTVVSFLALLSFLFGLAGCKYYHQSIPDYLDFWSATVTYSGDNLSSELGAWNDGTDYSCVTTGRHAGGSLRILVNNPKNVPFAATATVTSGDTSETIEKKYDGGDAISIPFSEFVSLDSSVTEGEPASDSYRVNVAWKRTDSGVEQGETEVLLKFRDQPTNGLIIVNHDDDTFPSVTQGGSVPTKTIRLRNVKGVGITNVRVASISGANDFIVNDSFLAGKILKQNDEVTFTVTPKSSTVPDTYRLDLTVSYDVLGGATGQSLTYQAAFTVNPPAHIRYVDGTRPTSGNGTEASPYKTVQEAVDDFKSLPDGSNAVIYLLGNVEDNSTVSYTSDITDAWISIDQSLNLVIESKAGNSYTINAKRNQNVLGRVMHVGGEANVTLRNVTLTGGHLIQGNEAESGGGVWIAGGSLTMASGASITGNNAGHGGGVFVGKDGTLTMNGGDITGNTVTSVGGGVRNDGSFTMTGGTITGNTAATNGGGVYNNDTGTFDMSGGATISNNTATSEGGGIYVRGGTFNLSSGTISYNTANAGGGVRLQGGEQGNMMDVTFTMSGGSISNNTATGEGGGVYVRWPLNSSTLTMTGGEISDNTATNNGGGMLIWQGTFNMSGGEISGNKSTAGSGGGVCTFGGTFNMSGGATVSGNTAAQSGGGVHLASNNNVSPILTMDGNSTISDNTANGGNGGGGVCMDKGTFTMSGGTISNNTANGGNGGGGVTVANQGVTFTMDGGTIQGNNAINGGGVYIVNFSTFNMNGGIVTGNILIGSTGGDAGVYLGGSSSFNMGGSAAVTNNAVYLDTGILITVTGSLTAAAPVATITPATYPTGGSTVTVLSVDSSSTMNLAAASKLFAVTDDASGNPWYVNDSGALQQAATADTVANVIQGLQGAGPHTVVVTGNLTDTADIKSALTSLKTSSPDATVNLDLSRVTGLTDLPGNAFRDVANLTSIRLPETLTKLGSAAFWGCTGLESIYIPDSVTTDLNGQTFNQSTNLTFLVNGTNPAYSTSADGKALYNKNKTELLSWPSASGQVTTIPSSVEIVGDSAFAYCTGLTGVTIPASVTTLESYAFDGCPNLATVTFGNSVTVIGTAAFRECAQLTNVTIPSSVKTIQALAFSETGLTSISIPDSVTTMGWQAFHGCDITFTLGSNSSFITADNNKTLYNKDQTVLYKYSPDVTGEVTLPTSVTTIERGALADCSQLTKVNLLSVLESIGTQAFMKCSGLNSMLIPANVNSIGAGAFEGCSSLTDVKFAVAGTWQVQSTIDSSVVQTVTVDTTTDYSAQIKQWLDGNQKLVKQ